jgi:hypothetical protein
MECCFDTKVHLLLICQSIAVKQKGCLPKDKSSKSFNFLLILSNRLGPNPMMAHVKYKHSLTTSEIWLGFVGKWLGSDCI